MEVRPVRRRPRWRWRSGSALQPDVVVLDLSLPGLDGLQVLAQARAAGPAHAGADPDRARHGGRPHHRASTPAPTTTCPSPSTWTSWRRACARWRRAPPARRRKPTPRLHAAEVGGLRYERDSGAIYHRRRGAGAHAARAGAAAGADGKPGHAVTKERLFELVFPGEADVQYEAIEVVVYRLRKKLARHRRRR